MSEKATLSIRLHYEHGASHAVDFEMVHDGTRAVIDLYERLIKTVHETVPTQKPA